MPSFFLELSCDKLQNLYIPLLDNQYLLSSPEDLAAISSTQNIVFSDKVYSFRLFSEDKESVPSIERIEIYINDAPEPCYYKNGEIQFCQSNTRLHPIFLDCYGYVQIDIHLELKNGASWLLSTGYLKVLVRNSSIDKNVRAMLRYVYKNQELLLFNGEMRSKNLSGFKNNGIKTLESKLILATEIAKTYESIFGYFNANKNYNIIKTPTVDGIEKLQQVTSNTLNYVASHPEHLQQVTSSVGLRINNKYYHPQKTLVLHNAYCYDTYENRIVIGFLNRMLVDIIQLQKKGYDYLQQLPKEEDFDSEYIYSSSLVLSETRKLIGNIYDKLTVLLNKFIELKKLYQTSLPITVESISKAPKPSPALLYISQYNKVFIKIKEWFCFGVYHSTELFMLPFIKVHYLYESYVLIRITEQLKSCGFVLQNSKRYLYHMNNNRRYKNTIINNTFEFVNGKRKATLYYQPVVFTPQDSGQNDINLYKNNTIPVSSGIDEEKEGAPYYSPDYILKISDGKSEDYLILDAKFSSRSSVRNIYIKELCFKYLISITPAISNARVVGLCAVYGKCEEREITFESIYNKTKTNTATTPYVELLPLVKRASETQTTSQLKTVLEKYLV